MTETFEQENGNEPLWRQIFAEGHPELNKQHWLHTKLPHKPRCKLCLVPFSGIGGWIMRKRGKSKSSRNPNFCNACDGFLDAFPGGADVELSILFVDIRHSTQFAEGAQPAEVSSRVNAFLDQATKILTDEDGFVMAFYGDCVVGVWPPGFSGPDHAAKAQRAARRMTQSAALTDAHGAPIPAGIGVHTGTVYIGTVSAAKGLFRDVSIFGSNVILTARLAAAASASEALVSADSIRASGADTETLESRTLEMKGITEPVAAFVLT